MSKKSTLIMISMLFLFTAISQAQPYYVMIPGADFQGVNGTTEEYFINRNGGYVYNISGYADLCAPVYFPHDKKSVKCMSVELLDNNVNGAIRVALYRRDMYTGVVWKVFEVSTTVGYASGSDTATDIIHDCIGIYRYIDNSRIQWYLELDLSPGTHIRLYQVRIKYE